MLRLTPAQMAAMDARQGKLREDAILDYLACHARFETEGVPEDDLRALIRAAHARGRVPGVRTDPGILRLCFLAAVTGGSIIHAPELEAALAGSGMTADDALLAVMDCIAAEGEG